MTSRLDQAFCDLERPFAWLDLDALDKNIQMVQDACGENKFVLQQNRFVLLRSFVIYRKTCECCGVYDIYCSRDPFY